EIAEDDPRWKRVALLAPRFKATDFVSTKFSAAELDGARFLGMLASGHFGYPEPSDNHGYLQQTFDLAGYCPACGVGKRQTSPFRLRKAPALANKFLQLNWIFDEFFVKPEVWAAIFQPLGIGFRPVALNKTGVEIDSVVQLDVSRSFDVNLDGRDGEECTRCGRKKYRYVLRGPYPKPVGADAMMFKSAQYFGSGANAFKLVFVSRVLYGKMKEAGLKGAVFYPCAE
ncbi:MAG TPA: hypothetical protein VKU44_01985, partial [Terriglobia bacterium]|nr:hypothetical protein [Terriglobia bacterium]